MSGFVMRRGWMDDPMFQSVKREPFCHRSAWCWLVEHAAHGAHSVNFHGRAFTLDRGQMVTSLLDMGGAWGWNTKKVSRFLSVAVERLAIVTATVTVGTIITICDYAEIQAFDKETVTPTGKRAAPRSTATVPVLELGRTKKKEEIPSVSPRNRGTRWVGVVCEEWVAETEGIRIKAKLSPVDGEAQAALFADFWVAKGGQAGLKLDWHATWRNWIRNARGGNGHDNGRQRLSPAEGIYKGWDTLIRGIEGEDNRSLDWQPAVPLLDRGRA